MRPDGSPRRPQATTSTRGACSASSRARLSTRAPRCSAWRPRTAPAWAWCATSGTKQVRQAVLARRPETVAMDGRVQAWLIGSGIDQARRSFVLLGDLGHALSAQVPVVLDSGALDLVGTHTAPTVITPHARELARLLTSREVPASLEEIGAAPGRMGRARREGARRRGAAEGGRDPRVRPRRQPLRGHRADPLAGHRRQRRRARRHPRGARRHPPCGARDGCRRAHLARRERGRGCTGRRPVGRARTSAGVRSPRSTSPRRFLP